MMTRGPPVSIQHDLEKALIGNKYAVAKHFVAKFRPLTAKVQRGWCLVFATQTRVVALTSRRRWHSPKIRCMG
jgi:hypothetical protein